MVLPAAGYPQPHTPSSHIPAASTLTAVKLARALEMRIEKLVEGVSAALLRGRMHPVDLANRLVRFIDLSVEDGPAGPQIGNEYRVHVNRSDIDESIDLEALEREMASAVTETAADKGWRIGGPISVSIVADDKTAAGTIRTVPDSVPGRLSPWGYLMGEEGDVIELGDNRMIVGRGAGSDAVVGHERVSRQHAILSRQDGNVWVADAGSANGTRVNGDRVGAKPVSLVPGDSVSFGPATFTLRLL